MFQLKRKLLEYPSQRTWMPLFEAKFCASPECSGHAEGELLGILKTSDPLLLKDPNATDETVIAGRFDRYSAELWPKQNGSDAHQVQGLQETQEKGRGHSRRDPSFDQFSIKFKEVRERHGLELDQDDFHPTTGRNSLLSKSSHMPWKNWTLQQCAKYIQMPQNPMYTPVAPEASSSSSASSASSASSSSQIQTTQDILGL